MQRDEILHFLKTHKQEIHRLFGVKKMGLFGSYAREEATPDSDIDIAVEIESSNKFRSFFTLLHYLEDRLHKKVDLGIESALKPAAKKQILKDIIYV